jgi:medium-chain acyl-[acyl-carrier-protein] hydrolase
LGSPRLSPALRLICLPWAGGGASGYWPLGRALPDRIEAFAYQPPGRETRLGAPVAESLRTLVADVLEATEILRDGPYLLLGHSFGAMLAVEVAGALRARGEGLPRGIVVSGCAAPACPPRHADIGHLPDAAFLKACADFGGLAAEQLADTELLGLVLPGLRADCRLAEAWRRDARIRPPASLPCPLLAVAGDDDPFVKPGEVAAWEALAGAGFTARMLPGGHFYLRQDPAGLAALIDGLSG